MIQIWSEFGRFKAITQKLADQVKTITMNGCFSDLEIFEIRQQIFRQTDLQTLTTVTKTIDIGRPKTANQTLNENNSCTAL